MKQMKTWKNLIYHGKCPDDNHVDEYIGETNRRIPERIKDHMVKDASSCLLRHSIESISRNIYVYPRDILQVCLISNGFKNNTMKRRIKESISYNTKEIDFK